MVPLNLDRPIWYDDFQERRCPMCRFGAISRCALFFPVGMACLGLDCQGSMPAGLPASALSTDIIRILQPGDFVTYNERREGFENGQPFTLVGTIRSSVLASTVADFAGNEARISTITTDLVQQENQVPITSMGQSYFSQDTDGTVYAHGFLDDTVNPPERRFVMTPTLGKSLSIPSPLRLGPVASAGLIEYTGGTTETGGTTAVEIEQVSVPAGSFVAVRLEGSATITSGMRTRTVIITSWFVPALGAAVKVESTVSVREGSAAPILTLTITSELRETNIPR